MKWVLFVAAAGSLSGCSGPSKLPATAAASPGLVRVFEFDGKGRRPLLNEDKSQEVQWVEVGPVTSSSVDDTASNGSWFVENHGPGRVGLKDGTVVNAQKTTLIYWMGRTLTSVGTH